MTHEEKRQLELLALNVREDIVKSTTAAGSGHPGGALSSADYLTYIYEKEMRIDPKNPQKSDRDRFVLSKGHAVPALYSILAHKGFFPVEDLMKLRKPNSYLQGHPSINHTPGIDASTGSLGQGISAACGMAKGAKVLGLNINVYTLLGDGELAEGEVWEAMMFAAHYKLENLCIAVDVNGLQIDGKTCDVMNTEPLDKKFEAFGCKVIKIDGHNFDEIEKALNFFHENKSGTQPTVILLKTIKGKGVSFMENEAGWHGKAAKPEECEKALAELENARLALETKG